MDQYRKKVRRNIKFNQKAQLNPYVNINTYLRKKAKTNFEKDLFNLMNNAVFGKTIENVEKHRDIKLEATETRRNSLVSGPNYETTKMQENLLAIEMRKTQIHVNKRVYLGLSILELNKTVTYEFWYNYVKPKYGEI